MDYTICFEYKDKALYNKDQSLIAIGVPKMQPMDQMSTPVE